MVIKQDSTKEHRAPSGNVKNKMQVMWWKWKQTLPNIWVVNTELVWEFLHLVDILGKKRDPKINNLYFHLWKLEGGEKLNLKYGEKKKNKKEISVEINTENKWLQMCVLWKEP